MFLLHRIKKKLIVIRNHELIKLDKWLQANILILNAEKHTIWYSIVQE